MAKADVNKSDAIREYFAANKGARPRDCVADLAKKNITVSAALVTNVRNRAADGKATKKQGRPAANGKATKATTKTSTKSKAKSNGSASGSSLVATVKSARTFAESLGGYSEARQALDMAEELDG